LLRFNELHETLQLRLSGEFKRFADEELRAVAGEDIKPKNLCNLRNQPPAVSEMLSLTKHSGKKQSKCGSASWQKGKIV